MVNTTVSAVRLALTAQDKAPTATVALKLTNVRVDVVAQVTASASPTTELTTRVSSDVVHLTSIPVHNND